MKRAFYHQNFPDITLISKEIESDVNFDIDIKVQVTRSSQTDEKIVKEIKSAITNLIEEDDGDNSEPVNGRAFQKSSSAELRKLINFLMKFVLVTGKPDLKTIVLSTSKEVEREITIIKTLKKNLFSNIFLRHML